MLGACGTRSLAVAALTAPMKDSWILGFLSVLALLMMGAIVNQQWDRFSRGVNDFIPLYSGPYLLGDNLYDNAALIEAEKAQTGMFSVEHGYIRLPFHAALLWPLSRLPYPAAYLIWQAASLGAVVGFILLWRQPNVASTLLMTCISVPVLHVWLKGQDVTFLLLAIAAAHRLHLKGWRFTAGLVFSLCAAKFHLFLLTPILIVGRRDWDFGKGLLSGGAALAAVSFAVAGWRWPVQFVESALNPKFSPGLSAMPNLHGALSELPASGALEMAASVSVALAVWFTARNGSFSIAFVASLVGGLLLSQHSYLLDTAVVLPAALTVMKLSNSRVLKTAALLVLVPPTAFLIGVGYPYSAVITGLMFLWLVGIAAEAAYGEARVLSPAPAGR